jgi:methyltransferase (TIGR00027 family)
VTDFGGSTGGDTWDIVSGVGATAVIVAAFRAEEANSATPLVRDEFAELLISTPQLSELRDTIASGWATSAETEEDHRRLVSYHAVRTLFFDRFCTNSVTAGVRQFVILASGLDSRAYRLAWAADTTVFELDMPEVLAYKSETLSRHRVEPRATLHEVGVDLRTDWPAAVRARGFDASLPTAWMLEGLLPFLEPQAQHDLFSQLDALSAPGSRVGAEDYSGVGLKQAIEREGGEARPEGSSGLDLGDLWNEDAEADCASWFAERGWHTETLDSRRESERLGRPVPSLIRGGDPVYSTFVTATKG